MKSNRLFHQTLTFAAAVLAGCTIFPADYPATVYVDAANGDDANDGLSRQAPLRTIQSAADRMMAGDTCLVMGGFYDERVEISTSGNLAAPIVFVTREVAVTRGFTVKADCIQLIGFEVTDTIDDAIAGPGIYVEGRLCHIVNNYIHDVTRQGILISAVSPDSPSTSHCVIRNNRIARAGHTGIWLYGRNHLIENNDISRILRQPRKWRNLPEWADADGMVLLGSGHVIRKNRIHDIHVTDPENSGDPHIDAFQIPGGPAYNIIFEQNVASVPLYPGRCMQIAMISGSDGNVRDLTFRNNVFVNTCRGLNIWGHGNEITGVIIANNTWVNFTEHAIELHEAPAAIVKNNIFYNIDHPYLFVDQASQAGLHAGHNCIFNDDGGALPEGSRLHDLPGIDPRFIDAHAGNLRLRADSPLIDAGKSLPQVLNDFDGVARPQGAGLDIGAFEFSSASLSKDSLQNRP